MEDSEEGAVAFVRHWIAAYYYSSNTGDVEPLAAVSDPDCEGCNVYLDLLEDVYESGGFIRGREWSFETYDLVFEQAPTTTTLETELQIDLGELRRDGESAVTSAPNETSHVVFGLERISDRWHMTHFASIQ